MKYHRRLSYVPGTDTEFCETHASFKERYIDHNPLSDECIARWRRLQLFMATTGLTEECRTPSFKHCDIHELGGVQRGRSSKWWLGGVGKTPFYMSEQYCLDLNHDPDLIYTILPEEISPHGGGPFNTTSGYVAPTTAILYTKLINKRKLDGIAKKCQIAAETERRWNSVNEQDRQQAEARVAKEKLLARLRGNNV